MLIRNVRSAREYLLRNANMFGNFAMQTKSNEYELWWGIPANTELSISDRKEIILHESWCNWAKAKVIVWVLSGAHLNSNGKFFYVTSQQIIIMHILQSHAGVPDQRSTIVIAFIWAVWAWIWMKAINDHPGVVFAGIL